MATQIDLGAVVPIGKGDWNEGTTYERANIVRHNSVAWICKVDSSIGVEPTESSSDWYLLVKDTSSVTSVNGQRGDVNLDIPSIMVGATDEINGTSGLVPKPDAGDQNKVLHGDGTWKSVAGKHIGEIFMYSGTDIPSGSLRLDGQSIVNVSSALPDFKAWAIDSGNAVTCTLAEYEAELSQYEDQCGKFGWDQATDTLRLPRISHFVGSALTVDNISKAVKAGLPNITGSQNGVSTKEALTGAFGGSLYQNASNIGSGSNTYYPLSYIDFNASRSSAVYGRSDTVTPSHVKFPYFIHVYDSVVEASEAQASEFVGLVDGLRQDVPEMLAKYLPLTGGKISGPIFQSMGALYTVITDAYKQVGLSCTEDGAGGIDGGLLILNTGTSKYNPGGFNLRARTGVSGQDKELIGTKDGSLVWFNKHIVRSVNNVNADVNGNVSVTRTSRADAADILAGFDFFAGRNSHTLPGYGTWIIIIAPFRNDDTALMQGAVYTAKVAGGTQYSNCYLAAFRVG